MKSALPLVHESAKEKSLKYDETGRITKYRLQFAELHGGKMLKKYEMFSIFFQLTRPKHRTK